MKMGDSIMTIAKDLKKQPWKFSIGDETQGIFRKLTEGISTRIFSGCDALSSKA